MLEKQYSQQQISQQQENSNISNLQSQHQKVQDELKILKVIFNQNSNPDLVLESLQIKEQLVVIQQQKINLKQNQKQDQCKYNILGGINQTDLISRSYLRTLKRKRSIKVFFNAFLLQFSPFSIGLNQLVKFLQQPYLITKFDQLYHQVKTEK
ncbi:unnamed protein product (macronuclear) [Paramecium tetraurelia]|uniref:Uncharacterized protein n=1 Tax=Paramecium tetraurelia TaxID=5888 RepID=A0C3Y2_PARTE|nr:uncharacterized protein GSPATT00034979001 [Paramecium tetraurelia]CAK65499.1 unnamed protein product [Paramecium tetraurelia]|eukprot:XP_001432896.1 hypothetical protein (macronuclear) [Paramecium tetraurelia strain d4-2]